jgi:ATP/maltotriose-dependent transcriptional regulator MalT
VALALVTGRYDESRRYAEAGLELARGSGRIRDMAVAENNLTWHEIRQGDLAAARRRLGAVERLASRSGEDRLRALAVANQAEVARLDGHPDEAVRLGRRALTELEGIGDPNHRRRVLATIGLALAEAGRVAEAEQIYVQLRPAAAPAFSYDGPQAVVEGAIAGRRGEAKRAAECFARAADAYEGTSDPRDLVTALVGLIVTTPDADRRDEAVRRLGRFCAESGLTLLPRERQLLGDP